MQISQGSNCAGVFFNNVSGPQNCNFVKKIPQSRVFPLKFTKFLRAPCFKEHLQWLLLKVSGFQPATLFQKRLRQRCFSVNFEKILKTSFLLTEHLRWLLLVLIYEFWEVFQITSLIEHLKETAISCTSCRISTTRNSKKLFPRQFLYKIER